jgi:2-dehydropantoate 2-reductase
VMRWKYRKLISNIGNVFQALVAGNGDWRSLAAVAEAEARRVLDAAGIAYIGDEEETAARAAGFTLKPVAGVDQFVADQPGSPCNAARGTSKRIILTAKS